MAAGDEFIWESDALARFCDHPRADIRRWALDRIRDRGATEAADAVFAHLNDPDENVAFDAVEALEALREKVSLEKARAPLYDLLQRDLMPGVVVHAASLLARSGAPRGVDRLEAECQKPSPGGNWENFIEVAPSRARALIEERGVAAKTRAWSYETDGGLHRCRDARRGPARRRIPRSGRRERGVAPVALPAPCRGRAPLVRRHRHRHGRPARHAR